MIKPSGNEALLVLAVNQDLLAPCLSQEILEEYSQVLRRARFGFTPREVDTLLVLLREKGELVKPAPMPALSPDPDGDKFIACSLTAKADFLVTGNRRHYRESWLSGTKLVNAAQLVQVLASEI